MARTAPAKAPVNVFDVFHELVSPEDIIESACRLGAIQRQRKVDMPALVQGTIAAVSPVDGNQTTAFANYISLTGHRLAPASFYERFSEPFAALMRELALRAVKAVREQAPADRRFADFGVLLEEFRDVQVMDATTHITRRLDPESTKKSRPGIKWHTLISLKDGLPVADAVTSRHAGDVTGAPDEFLSRGTLTLMDKGYTDLELFIDAINRGADFLTRLKSNGTAIITRVHVGKGDRAAIRGCRLNDVFDRKELGFDALLTTDRGVLDLDVRLEKDGRSAAARIVAITGNGELHWFLTSVGRDVLSPKEVADAYRLRWNIELFFKQLKSGTGLNAVGAGRRSATTAMLYAKVIALALARLLELALEEKAGRHAMTQLALVVALTRCAPLLLSMMMMARGVTLAQLEERILLIASITARSRNKRRERARRKRERALGTA